ncbi:MAG: hypothetical protein CMJ51_04720 [Planctomycetaceae bacterium]|nr:hypothetical protein [Planctomycetaceae bacterium]
MTKPSTSDHAAIAELSSGEKRDLLGLGALAAAWALVPAGLGFLLLARIGWVAEVYTGIIDEQGLVIAIAIYALIFGVTAGLGLLPTYAQAILGGWIFGTVFGTVGAMMGILLGALLGHGLARLISGNRVEAIIERRPKVLAVRNALVDAGLMRSIGIVALLRVSPNSPFALSNLALGGSRTPLIAMFFGTAFGMLPRTALAAGFAAAAAADGSKDLVDVVRQKGLPLTLVGILTLLITVAVIAAVGNAALKRVVPGVDSDQASGGPS